MDYLQEIFNNGYGRHSEYQIRNFIIKLNGKTDWGMYKQSIREILSRIEECKRLSNEIIALKDDFNTDNMTLNKKEVQLNDLLYELNIFWNLSCQLRSKIGDLNPEKVKILESEFWKENFKQRICFELLGTGHISPSLIEVVVYSDSKNELIEFLTNMDKNKAIKFISENVPIIEIKQDIPKLKLDQIEVIEARINKIDRKLLLGK